MPRSFVRVGWCFLAAVLFGTAGVRGQGVLCTPELLGTYASNNGSISSAEVIGDVAYMRVNGSVIQSVDVSDPANPFSLDALPSEYLSGFVRVDDGMLCAWNYDEGLMFLDVSNPERMEVLSEFRTFGTNEVAFANGTGYLAKLGSLTVVRVDSTGHAAEIGRVLGNFGHVVLMDQTAIVVRSSSELVFFDISDPESPVEVAQLHIGTSVREIVLAGSTLYAFVDEARFLVLDVSSPDTPLVIGECAIPAETAGKAVVVDDRLYAGLSHAGIAAYSLSEPHDPELIGWMDVAGGGVMAIGEGFSMVSAWSGTVNIYDTTEWPAPAHRAVIEIAEECTGLVLDGDRAVLSFSTVPVAMQVIDIADPAHPRVVGEYLPADGYPGYGVAVSGEYAYLAKARAPAELISIEEPDAPASVGIVGDPDSYFFDFEVQEGLLYGASERHGLVIFDLADPAAPVELSRLRPSFGNIRYVALGSGVVYLASATNFAVIDVSNPTDPVIVQEVPGPFWIERVRVDGDRLLVVGSGIAVYDIQDPLSPLLRGSVAVSPTLRDVFLVGDVAYCAGDFPLSVFDLPDHGDPSLIRRLSPTSSQFGAGAQRGGLGYFGASSNGDDFVVIGVEPCDRCVGDWNGDGMTNSIDLVAFLNVWAAERGTDCSQSDCSADIDENDMVDSRDFIAFLNAWNAGC
ncbi:MAG: GC-type dockerin domain-anchored protein [Phycisphaerales bacterium JB054]